MRTSCIYSRGLTPAYSGAVTGTPAQIDQTLKVDKTRMTSVVLDGHGSSYMCGFGSIFMNGKFPQASFYVDPLYGWMGDYSRSDVNTQGAIRHLITNLRFITRAYRSTNWLVISDKDSLTDMKDMSSWAQLVKHLDTQGFNVLAHTPAEIQAGAYGYDTRPEYFMQFAGVLLLLSGTKTLNNNLARALTDSLTLGASVAVLQKSPTEGRIPFDQIFSPIGIENGTPAYIKAMKSMVADSKTTYKDHVSWTKITDLHNQMTHRLSATFKVLATGKGKSDNVAGQAGDWTAVNCIEVSDETDIRQPVFYNNSCCVRGGDRYTAEFTAPLFPELPSNFQKMFDQGHLKGTWTSDNALSLSQRAKIWIRCAGKNAGQSHINIGTTRTPLGSGYSVILLNKNLQIIRWQGFNTTSGGQGGASGVLAAKNMKDYIDAIPDGTLVLIVSNENAMTNHTASNLPKAIYSLGGSRRVYDASWFRTGACYLLLGRKGNVEGNNTIEMYYMPRPIEGVTTANAFTTGFSTTDEDVPYCCGTEELERNTITVQGMVNNGQYARLKYNKRLSEVDGSKKYGIKHVTTLSDTRFKKLPIRDTKNTVVSVENPCIPAYTYDPLDWIRVWQHPQGIREFKYPLKDQHEYMLVQRDSSGNIFTQQFTFFYDIYNRCGQILWDNNAGQGLLKIVGNTGNTTLLDDHGSVLQQLYERKMTVVPKGTVPSREANEWELWGAYDNNRRSVNLEAGYEYIMHIEDWHGKNEFAQKRILIPAREHEPQWSGGTWYYCGSTNSCSMAINNRQRLDYYNGKYGNPVTRILRRPIYLTTDTESKSEWVMEFLPKDRGVLPQGTINLNMQRDCEYFMCAVGNTDSRNITSIGIYTWNRIFDLRETGGWAVGKGLEGSDTGACGWDYTGTRIPQRLGAKAYSIKYVNQGESPYGVYMILKRKMHAWEVGEVDPEDVRLAGRN